jgi:hypothetical protein
MSYTSVPTEPENATTAIGGRRYSSDTPTRMFMLPKNNNFNSIPPPTGSQLRRSSKIGRSSGEFKRQSIKAKFSSKYKLISPENEEPSQHLKIIMPLPSQLSNDLKDEQETFSSITHGNNKTLKEILKMPWTNENDNKFSKKFWLVLVISLLILFGILIIGFGKFFFILH